MGDSTSVFHHCCSVTVCFKQLTPFWESITPDIYMWLFNFSQTGTLICPTGPADDLGKPTRTFRLGLA